MSDIHPPLVSIIVRTKDRPKLLQKALRSIAVQTYRNIEVVLVNDGGVDLDIDDLKNLLGGMTLIYVKLDVNRGRAHAANEGIGNALGGYVGFLDDDDEYYPEHVATLVTFLEQSDYKVAYTGTEMVYQEYDAEEQRMAGREKLVFSRDFSYKDLLIVNYIPFNSILFSKNVIQSAGEFDESFPLYEDWDFLIRAASVFPFYHIRKITTMYRQWSRGMQINQADEAYMRDLRLKIIEKHREKIVPGKILEIHDEKERLFIERDRLSETLAERNSHVSRLEALLSEKERLLYEKERMILEREQVISEKETHITRLDGDLRDQVQRAAELEKQLRDRDGTISGLESAIGAMRDTLGWRMLETFRRWRERLLPPGKRRRRVYDLAVRSVKVFKAEGIRGVVQHSRTKLSLLSHTARELAGKASTVYRTKGFGTFVRYCAAYMLHGPGYFNARQAYTQDAYEQWIRKHEEPDMQHLRLKAKDLSYMPTISVMTPVYNVDPKWLRRCIDSVISQAYGNWELCIYDDASTNDGTLSLLKTMTGHDGRIKVVLGKENLGIAGATNEALAMATGEFIALLDNDDELSPDALYEVAALLNRQPDLDLIYSDEDRIVETAEGEQRRYDPFFKPDWDPHLLFASMYTGHLSVYRKSIVEAVGGFRRAYDYSQDYDLALRVTERTNRIGHIRKVLYHWRAIPGSAAAGGKDFARTSNIGALTSAVQRRGYDAEVLEYPFANRVKFRIKNPPFVSVIIPTDNRTNVLSCIDLLLRHTGYPNYEVVVVTNSPLGGEIKQTYSHDHRIRICPFDQPFNFSLKCNRGAEFASGEYLLFLNDDVEATHESWIEDMVGVFGKGNVGGVSPKLYYENDTIQFAGMVTGVRRLVGTAFHCQPKDSGMYFNLIQSERNVSLLSGACLLMAKTLFTDVGGFDAVNTPVMHSDIDLCFKLLDRGYELIYTPFASLRHIGHLSLRETDKQEHRKKRDTVDLHVLKKWGDYL
ncbi:MAG TPA: glycosyltransferase, partial [Dissulfurispiraceae bacterium]|nr:glycosyltransferase [Dissulfurispiraceae bacterium]